MTVEIADYAPHQADELVRLWRESFEHGVGVTDPHPLDEQRAYFESAVLPAHRVRVALRDGRLVGFMAANERSVGQLYVRVGETGQGIGAALIGLAQAYAKERRQFKVPIATFGLIQEKIGRMAADTYALESAVYRLAGSMDAATDGKHDPAAQLAALNDYAVEYSFIKVFGSEILDYVVDEALQIYGGYGFSADYPIELAYRNSRINRIFEGTNEINRELTVDQLLKRAMRGELDLLGPAQAAMLGRPVETVTAPAAQADAELALANLKLGTLMVAGMGAMAYMQGLEREQELLARVADMVGLCYMAESALLRSERLQGARGGEVALLLARLYAFAAVDRARDLGTEALRRIPRGKEALPRFQAYLAERGVDLVELRRQAAEAVYAADGYPLG